MAEAASKPCRANLATPRARAPTATKPGFKEFAVWTRFATSLRARAIQLLLLPVAVLCGCASSKAPPPGFSLFQATLASPSVASPPVSNGTSSTATGAGRGAVVGVSTGVVAGGVACLGTGPFFPLCLLVVVPAATAVGTAGGAATGAVLAETDEESALKLSALRTQVDALSCQALLVTHLQNGALKHFGAAIPVANEVGVTTESMASPQVGEVRPWEIEVTILDVTVAGREHEGPFEIWMEARLTLRHAGDSRPAFEKIRAVTNGGKLTIAQWRDNDDALLRLSLEQSVRQLAAKFLTDLTRVPAV